MPVLRQCVDNPDTLRATRLENIEQSVRELYWSLSEQTAMSSKNVQVCVVLLYYISQGKHYLFILINA